MKRLAAIVIVVALSNLPLCAQHGGSRGGFSGSHGGGFSAPRGSFSGSHASSAPSPSFHGGSGSFARSGPPGFAGGPSGSRNSYPQPPSARPPFRYSGTVQGPGVRSPQYVSNSVSHPGRMPYPGRTPSPSRGLRPVVANSSVPRQLNAGTSHRMPYHSPNGGDRGDHTWNHGGGGHDHGGVHHHVIFVGVNRWLGFPYVFGWAGSPWWPWWGWNYPILPASWNLWNNDDPPAGNSAEPPYPEYMPGPYDTGGPDQPEPQQQEYTSDSRTGAPATQPESAPAHSGDAFVTLVFRDGRPNEQIHNYMLTSTTLSVLDQGRRDIPVDQLDLSATARLNREAGIEFSLPGGGR